MFESYRDNLPPGVTDQDLQDHDDQDGEQCVTCGTNLYGENYVFGDPRDYVTSDLRFCDESCRGDYDVTEQGH